RRGCGARWPRRMGAGGWLAGPGERATAATLSPRNALIGKGRRRPFFALLLGPIRQCWRALAAVTPQVWGTSGRRFESGYPDQIASRTTAWTLRFRPFFFGGSSIGARPVRCGSAARRDGLARAGVRGGSGVTLLAVATPSARACA